MKKPGAYLLRFGELALKGRNRNRFIDELVAVLASRLRPLGGTVERLHKKLMVHCEAEPEQVRKALSTVFGITSISPIRRTGLAMDQITDLSWLLMKPHAGSGKSFAVRVKRTNKRFAHASMEVQQLVASELLKRGLNLPVNLSKPDLTLGITLDFTTAWVFLETWPGLGGLPVSPRSRHGLLISGGIDSPVAGHLIQKRGGWLEAIYFHTPPFTVEAAKDKVIDLCSLLASYQNGLNLHVVNITEIMKALRAECIADYLVVLQRRFMMRLASRILDKTGSRSLVTGECLGQVASQTIENIAAIDEGVSYPVLRPLIGLDKLEIIAISKRIEAYEISIRPFQDCCSMFSPKNPITRARPELVRREEAKLDIQALADQAMDQVETISLR